MLVIMNRIKLLIIVAAILLFWTPDTLKATPIIEVDKTEKSVETDLQVSQTGILLENA